jgi:hypothetical protein
MNIAIFVAVVFIICMIVAAQQSCCSVGRASWEAGTTYTAGEIVSDGQTTIDASVTHQHLQRNTEEDIRQDKQQKGGIGRQRR